MYLLQDKQEREKNGKEDCGGGISCSFAINEDYVPLVKCVMGPHLSGDFKNA